MLYLVTIGSHSNIVTIFSNMSVLFIFIQLRVDRKESIECIWDDLVRSNQLLTYDLGQRDVMRICRNISTAQQFTQVFHCD